MQKALTQKKHNTHTHARTLTLGYTGKSDETNPTCNENFANERCNEAGKVK